MITLTPHRNFTFGFEVGWLFLDLFVGCYTISFDLNPRSDIQFEAEREEEDE